MSGTYSDDMTTQPRRQTRGTARRDTIIDAARSLITQHGPSYLTHRRVADTAGVPLAATTYYFTSLVDLLAAAGERMWSSWTTHTVTCVTQALMNPPHTPDEYSAVIVDAILPQATTPPCEATTNTSSAKDATTPPPPPWMPTGPHIDKQSTPSSPR